MSCLVLVKAALARFLFGTHTLVIIWRVVSQEQEEDVDRNMFETILLYWMLIVGIIVLFLEGLYALCYRKGEELRHVCPSVVIYLASIIPAIWILETKANRRELLCFYTTLVMENVEDKNETQEPSKASILQNILLDMMQVRLFV